MIIYYLFVVADFFYYLKIWLLIELKVDSTLKFWIWNSGFWHPLCLVYAIIGPFEGLADFRNGFDLSENLT